MRNIFFPHYLSGEPGCLHTFLFKKNQTLLSNVQLIRFHIAKAGIYMEFKQNPH